jgi:hypothetical protein
MINVRIVICLALRGFSVSKLVFTNTQFNKMVLKTSGPPLHRTRQASSKKRPNLSKNYTKVTTQLKLKQVAYLPVGLVAS